MLHPEKLGKYQVTGVLGEGAMGVVYKGFDPGIGRAVALKTVRHALAGGDKAGSMAARFRNEAQAAGRLAHPGIVAVYDFGEAGDVAFIAMEYVEGSSLSRYIAANTRFGDDDVLSVMGQLLDALGHAHDNGVWHRDIKPANLLLTNAGRLKVADFGIARIESIALTMVTTVVGTPGYMAPEQFLGKGVDRRSDLYAAGVLLYQLLVGKTPFSGTTESLMYRVVHEPPVLPSAVPGFDRGPVYDEILAKALAKEPVRRFATASEFKHALVTTLGRPVQAQVSEDTLITVKDTPAPSPAGTASTASHWDRAVLAQVEASLARHVGPLAAVLVKRAARECSDLATLYQKLAEQVTNPAARSAFISQVSPRTGGGTGSTGGAAGSGTRPPPTSPPASPASGRVDDGLVAQSTKLLAQFVGPIASVVAKRAAAASGSRETYFAALEAAVTDPALRSRLRAGLDKLP